MIRITKVRIIDLPSRAPLAWQLSLGWVECVGIADRSAYDLTVHAKATGTQLTAQEDLAEVLERLPFGRDLRMINSWSCGGEPVCGVAGGRIEESRVEGVLERRWSGPEGPASVRLEPGRARLEDGRRGYSLLVVGEGVGGEIADQVP